MPHLILFTDANFQGLHKHVFDTVTTLSLVETNPQGQTTCIADCDFPNGVSSIVIFSGNWQFFQGENQTLPFPVVLGPGLYRFVGEVKLSNDNIRSIAPVLIEPNMAGEPLNGEVVLFEHANFHGDHLHLFEAQKDLSTVGFDKKTSSIVVKSGNWSFYSDSQFDGSYPRQPVFGPGIYSWVEAVGINNDSISSLQPSAATATIGNPVDNEVILCQYGSFYGPHKHVFAPEANLNADDDDFFNDNVASLAILAGVWSFYADWNFSASYGSPVPVGIYPALTTVGITVDDMSSLRPTIPTTVTSGTEIHGHVILFRDKNFHGPHKHVFNLEDNLNADGDDSFNDSVSSIAVLSGNWQFFRNSGFNDDYPAILGPGLYSWVEDFNIRNDDISSLELVDEAPTVTGAPFNAHIILFENANFHGAHRHVFAAEANLNSSDDNSFNDVTSAIAVLQGVWATFGDDNFNRQYMTDARLPILLGPGLYSWVGAVQIPNDDLTSLQPVDSSPNLIGTPLLGHAILFNDINLRGAHKHILNSEDNLDADDDNSFNDATSSIAVLLNQWFTYRDAKFHFAYDVTLGTGLFPVVESIGIANNDMSSLTVAGERRQLIGTATINIASGQVPEPVVVDVTMTFLFYPDSRALLVENGFGSIAVGTLGTIQYDSADDGMFPADGTVSVPNVKITASSGFLSADATFTLSTGNAVSPSGRYNVTGSPADLPADALGNVKLVGASALAGDDFSIELAGVFTVPAA